MNLFTLVLTAFAAISPLRGQVVPEVSCDVFFLPSREMLKSAYNEEELTDYQIFTSYPKLYPSPPSDTKPFQLEAQKLSKGIRYQGPSEFICYERGPMNPNGDISWIPRIRVDLPENATQVLILVDSESSKNQEIWNARALDISEHHTPVGSLIVYNDSNEPLVVKSGQDTPKPLRSHDTVIIPTRNLDAYRLKVSFAGRVDDQWKLIINRRMLIDPTKRILCPVYYDANAKTWKVNQYILPSVD